MNEEVRVVEDRHFYVPLTDEEYMEVKRRALEARVTIKHWVQGCIREQLKKED